MPELLLEGGSIECSDWPTGPLASNMIEFNFTPTRTDYEAHAVAGGFGAWGDVHSGVGRELAERSRAGGQRRQRRPGLPGRSEPELTLEGQVARPRLLQSHRLGRPDFCDLLRRLWRHQGSRRSQETD